MRIKLPRSKNGNRTYKSISTSLIFFSATIPILALTIVGRALNRFPLLSSRIFTSYFSFSISNMAYQQELRVAELAVQRATLLTQKVFHEKAKGTVAKDDRSPVTMGDFGAQALIIQAIRKNFPDDEIVAEEEATSLREDEALSSE